MNARNDGRPRIEKPDHAGEAAARIGDADDGAAGGEFAGHQQTTRARLSGLRRRLAIADERDLARAGGFERAAPVISRSPAPSQAAFSAARFHPRRTPCLSIQTVCIQTYAS